MDEITLGGFIEEERANDTEDDSNDLVELYNQASEAEKAILDRAFIMLTGWQLKTLIEKYQRKIS